MEVKMKMPDLSTTGDEVRVVAWLIEVGGEVSRGAPLLEVETDKATMEVEAIASGVLKSVLAPAGDTVSVGQVIAVIEATDMPTARDATHPPSAAAAETPAAAEPLAPPVREPTTGTPGKTRGMFARNRARSTGPEPEPGQGAMPAASRPAVVPMTVAKRAVARRMMQSKQTIPHYHVQRSFDAERIVACRRAAGGDPIVWDAFFVAAAARALPRYECLCHRLDGEQLRSQVTEAINVAVDVNDDLFVVHVTGAAARSLEEISSEIRQGVERLRAGDAEAARVRPADLTISNLGGVGIECFVPIINPPEAAILGIGAIALQPVVVDGSVVVRHRATLTLCVDHRIVNGRYAAAFLGEIVAQLESFGEGNGA